MTLIARSDCRWKLRQTDWNSLYTKRPALLISSPLQEAQSRVSRANGEMSKVSLLPDAAPRTLKDCAKGQELRAKGSRAGSW